MKNNDNPHDINDSLAFMRELLSSEEFLNQPITDEDLKDIDLSSEEAKKDKKIFDKVYSNNSRNKSETITVSRKSRAKEIAVAAESPARNIPNITSYLSGAAVVAIIIGIGSYININRDNIFPSNNNDPLISLETTSSQLVTTAFESAKPIDENTQKTEELIQSTQESLQSTQYTITDNISTEINQIPVTQATQQGPNDHPGNGTQNANVEVTPSTQPIITEVTEATTTTEIESETTQEIIRPYHQDHPTDNRTVSGADIVIENKDNCKPGEEITVKISLVDLYASKALSLGQMPYSSDITLLFDEGLEYIDVDFLNNTGCTCSANGNQLEIHLDLAQKENFDFDLKFRIPELINDISTYHVYIPEDKARTIYSSETSSQTVLNYNRCGTISVNEQ